MILTGKAKEDFKEWLYNKYDILFNLEDYYKTMLCAEIIDWFDSVGIYIEIGKEPVNFLYIVHKGDYKKAHFKCGGFNTRQEATEEAIKKACEIYNKN